MQLRMDNTLQFWTDVAFDAIKADRCGAWMGTVELFGERARNFASSWPTRNVMRRTILASGSGDLGRILTPNRVLNLEQ